MTPRLTSPTIGRDAELAALREALAATAAGAGRCLVLGGPAGIGKSRLLAEARAEAGRLGMAVAAGRATELDRVAPLATLLTALRGSVPPVVDGAGMAALGAAGSQVTNRFWLVEQLGELIEEYVRLRPLLIVLDDAHAADELTAVALQILVPRLQSCAVTWLLAQRPGPAKAPMHEVTARLVEEGAVQLTLPPLDPEAIAEVCTHVLGSPPAPRLRALAARSDGNPFLLEQLLTMLNDHGWLQTAGGTVTSVAEDGLPAGFLSAVEYQLRHLSEPAHRLLEAASVFGRPCTVHEAARLLGRSAVAVVPAVEEAVAAHVLVDDGTALAFRHDLIRDAVYGNLSGAVRQTLHQEAAVLLEAEGRPGAEAVLHRIRGARPDDPRTLEALSRAVDEVAPIAPSTAADLMLQLLDLLPADSASRPHAIAETVRLLAVSGRLGEAQGLGEQALRGRVDPAYEATMCVGLCDALKHAGQDATVIEYTARVLARPGIPEPVRAQLLAIQSHAMLVVGDSAGAERSALAAAAAGEPSALVYAESARSAAAHARGDVAAAIAIASEAVEVADQDGGDARHRHPRLWLGRALVAADRFSEAEAVYELGEREARELGTAWSQPLWHFYQAELRLAAGRLDDAEAEALAGERVAQQLTALALLPSLLGLLADVAVHKDELGRARDLLRRAVKLGDTGNGTTTEDLAWPQAQLQAAQGDGAAAFATLAAVYGAVGERPLLLTLTPWAAPAMVRIALDAGARTEAGAVAAAVRSLAASATAVPSLQGAAAHAEGLLRADADALRAAVEAYRDSPRRLARAAALEDLALAEAAAGARPRGVALMEEALELYAACGAVRDAARTQRALRGMGVRRKRWQQTAKAQTGWDSLTGAELRVVRLVAEGLTNRATAERLFLSPHTVDTHLRRAFAKLGVSTRVELARQAITHDDANDRVKA
ncbi:helix-turn-helix transcriptional regulator [Streptomyces sp. NPDC101132]|uniref:helix-turn-helix transcriptional regulator n=1 Tax=Streptomyces sp. NPDC101132 TaxID=3366110 RepID=UPI00381B7029